MPLPPPVAHRPAPSQRPAGAPVSLLPPPGPTPVLAMGHCFYVPALGRASGLRHRPAHISGKAPLAPGAVILHFRALPDDLRFEINRAQLAASPPWLASYPLRCHRRPAAPASIWYPYTREDVTGLLVSSLKLSSNSLKVRGYVAITAYDVQRQLVSGYTKCAPTASATLPPRPTPAMGALLRAAESVARHTSRWPAPPPAGKAALVPTC